MRAVEQPVDDPIVSRSRTPDEAIVSAIETLYVELLPRFDTIHLPEFRRQNDLAFGRDASLHERKILPYIHCCQGQGNTEDRALEEGWRPDAYKHVKLKVIRLTPQNAVSDRMPDGRGFAGWRPLARGAAGGAFLDFQARLGNLWVDSGSCEGSIEVAAEFAAGGLKGSLLFF